MFGRSIFLNDHVRCAVNPDAGHESEVVGASARPRYVVVVGGGPAGLECARRLAERGHRVELWEAGGALGGRLALAERADPDLAGLSDWLAGAAHDAGVEIHLWQPATAASLQDAAPHVVVWAAGATWDPDPGEPATPERQERHPGIAGSGVLGLGDVRDWLLGGDDPLGATVAIRGGGKAAVTIAGVAARAGHQVTLVSESTVLAPELGLPGRFRLVHDTEEAGVELRPGSTDLPDADSVLAIGPGAVRPAPELTGIDVHVIGDASGTSGIAAGLRAAADLAATL